MAKIIFWSPDSSMTGATHTAIAVATLMSITHKATSILMQGNYDSQKIESAFTPYDELKSSGAFQNSNIGVNALIRLVTSNKLTSDAVQNYAKPLLKERLDILYGMNQKNEEDYISLANNLPYIIKKASEIYDLVFMDLPKGNKEKYILDTLSEAETVVCIVNQDSTKLDDFFTKIENISELKDKNKIIVIADYEQKSKYNVQNIKIKYRYKGELFTLPHNYVFSDSCNDGNVIDFFYSNLNADPKDYNGYFVSQVMNIVEKIVEVNKIKDI